MNGDFDSLRSLQRSKNRSLKMHNALHNWLQSIRASRKKVAEEKKNEGEMYDEEVEEVGIKYSQPVEEVKGEEVLKQPVVVKESNGFSIPLIQGTSETLKKSLYLTPRKR